MAKSANLLVDGLGGPSRVGIWLPLHWQTLVLVLAGVATGATVVVVDRADGLAGCDVACTGVHDAEAGLDAGVDDVLAVSLHPLGAPLAAVPAMVLDHAREVPSYGDQWGGPAVSRFDVEVGGSPLGPLPVLGLQAGDRVLASLAPADPAGLRLLLGVLHEGAALLLVPDPLSVDLAAVALAERLTASAGVDVAGVPRLPGSGSPHDAP